MADLSNVIKVTQTQYNTLKNGGTVGGYTYDENAIYLVDEPAEGCTQLQAMTSIAASATSTITVANMTNYKYIIIRAYYTAVNNTVSLMLPTKYLRTFITGDSTASSATLVNLTLPYSGTAVRWIRFGFPSDTSVFVANGTIAAYYGIWGYND